MRNHGYKTSDPTRWKVGGAFRWWGDWFKSPRRSCSDGLEQRLKAGLVLDPETGCHVWTGTGKGRNKGGRYGHIGFMAHRLAWELAKGPIPVGLNVLHKCDNPACCNPDHLFLGTAQENIADKVRKGRVRNGHTGKIGAPRRQSSPRQTGRKTGFDAPAARSGSK